MSLLWAFLLLLVLPAGVFGMVFGAMAVAAVPLSLLLLLLLPRSWRQGLPPATLFTAGMLLSPVLLLAGLALAALAGKPLDWPEIEWRAIEHARLPGDTWRHLFPMRPPRGAPLVPEG
ncbi:MAG: hypothetical protein N3D18_01765 [Roseococcus sp.]|nr:hypothetical protein [Roseococcus sp.]